MIFNIPKPETAEAVLARLDARIKWVSGNDGTPGCGGYWDSSDGRFSITPYYRHTVNPDGYKVRDNSDGTTYSVDRVREAKAWALRRVLSKKV